MSGLRKLRYRVRKIIDCEGRLKRLFGQARVAYLPARVDREGFPLPRSRRGSCNDAYCAFVSLRISCRASAWKTACERCDGEHLRMAPVKRQEPCTFGRTPTSAASGGSRSFAPVDAFALKQHALRLFSGSIGYTLPSARISRGYFRRTRLSISSETKA